MTIAQYDFDTPVNRRGVNCAKHDLFDEDVLAMWVADADFRSPEVVMDAMKARIDHGVFGYDMGLPRLGEVICQRMADLYDWAVKPEEIVYIPGVVAGFNIAIRAFGEPGDTVLVQTPIYPPMLSAPGNHYQTITAAELKTVKEGNRLRYEIDFDAFEAAISDNTRVFLLCSPHNPTGRVWTRDELTKMAEICEKHNVVICSDEIHCDLVFSESKHIPTASLSPEISKNTITIMSPSKTFNLPGLRSAFVIIQDEDLRKQYQKAEEGIVGHVNTLGFVSSLAAYEHGGQWLSDALAYMQVNRDLTTQFVEENMPEIAVTHPEGTYLTWMDTSKYYQEGESDNMFAKWIDQFFLNNAKVALNAGGIFGESAKGFVRFNFATQRSNVIEALERMKTAMDKA